MIIVAVFKFDVPPNITIRPGSTSIVAGKPIFTIPLEVFTSCSHSSDMLTLMRVGLQQHEGGVRRKNYGIGGVTIRAAAMLDVGVPVVHAVWKRTGGSVLVVTVFVIPSDVSLPETLSTFSFLQNTILTSWPLQTIFFVSFLCLQAKLLLHVAFG